MNESDPVQRDTTDSDADTGTPSSAEAPPADETDAGARIQQDAETDVAAAEALANAGGPDPMSDLDQPAESVAALEREASPIAPAAEMEEPDEGGPAETEPALPEEPAGEPDTETPTEPEPGAEPEPDTETEPAPQMEPDAPAEAEPELAGLVGTAEEEAPPSVDAVPEPVPEAEPEAVEAKEAEAEVVPVVAKAKVTAKGDGDRAASRQQEEEAPPVITSPFDGPGDWYVVHTYAGYENKVRTNLFSRIGSMQMEDKIFDVVIPMEDVMEIKGGKKQVVQKKVFPGYLLVKMIYDNDSWYVVRNTPGVTGFVSSGTGSKPTPLSRREVEKILAVKQETAVKPQYRLEWEVDDVVRIITGPFADFTGTIAEINVEQSKLKVLVNIFDRETPVELAFDQVAKA